MTPQKKEVLMSLPSFLYSNQVKLSYAIRKN